MRISILLSLSAILLGSPGFAGASQYSTNYPACSSSRCSPGALEWSSGEFDQIYLAEEAGVSFRQPAKLSASELVPELQRLKRGEDGVLRPMFDEESAQAFARGLVVALGEAHPAQVALFLVTNASGLFGSPRGNSGQAFIDEKGLNLIFGEVGIDFVGSYHGVGKARSFDFGNRTKASSAMVSGGGLQRRSDWIVIPLKTALVAATPSPQPSFEAEELRLRRLRSLRDQNLITEQEYEAKKAAILKEF